MVTVLYPLIGYAAGAKLVEEPLTRKVSICNVARKKARKGEFIQLNTQELVIPEQVNAALDNLRKLTEGGITGIPGGEQRKKHLHGNKTRRCFF